MTTKPKKQNSESPSLFQKMQESYQFMRECPLCKKKNDLKQMQVILEKESVNLVHTTCSHCSNAILSLISISEVGMSSIGLFTDLNANEVLGFLEKEPLEEENVLDFHLILKNNSTNFLEKLTTDN